MITSYVLRFFLNTFVEFNLYYDIIYQGSGLLVLEPRETISNLELEISDQEGKVGIIKISVEYKQITQSDVTKLVENSYEDISSWIPNFLRSKESAGTVLAEAGYTAFYPIMIIPGIASSGLECWETDHPSWFRERIWMTPSKLTSHTANTIFTKVKATLSFEGQVSEWRRHILLAEDGYSDPPNIKVRPCSGFSGIDYIVDSGPFKSASYVFGPLIEELAKVGYDPRNLDAAPVSRLSLF